VRTVTLIPGDDPGPELITQTRRVLEASGARLTFELVSAGQAAQAAHGMPLPPATLDSIRRNKIAILGSFRSPPDSIGLGVSQTLRREFDLFARICPCQSWEGIRAPGREVDLVIVREALEDLLLGIEHPVGSDAAEAVRIVTREESRRVAHAAFEYAAMNARRKITIVHQAPLLRRTDGLFLETAREAARDYPALEVDDRTLDRVVLELVQKPEDYDVLLCPNLYGDVLSGLAAGLVGGAGMAPGMSLGREVSVFEAALPGAPDWALKHPPNPAALILSGALMLERLSEPRAAERVRRAVRRVMAEGKCRTPDLGGTAGTREMADAILEALSVK
jgi:isocitrate dehydrogenase (NAD+)